ncbi:peptidoglycan D,D-transpeptidase FtsI family protein [Burkholderia gladioli]|jgi:cell division protein FtsI (penicillin-binding protein 3)|uniref:Peptidoglycan D,D-transpeptidase FtsI n=1 Tax=Burkholderia gladioli TaxID=28095 RepID=A0AAP1Y130_BURGA|nr:penicillin-binding protein 2 [Burkholderia gladioli]AJW99953.1 penicillin binding transpeptidase domain protein [Burkholderia gladioli]ASD77984.1 cell division protein [Burkholderia gladioli pv. gladioli]AWY53105.1 cell division protein [Burkholderia gladioli pv. gladioli]KAF1064067.1 putative peptidoglycan D,D-transpeptidase PenA [Burkholderia gladioli]KGC16310.1 penicillin binding transpeptidase domain protein [Burkholderia gladioli]
MKQRQSKSSAKSSVKFASSPVLSVHLPMWRSKLVVFMLFMAFVALAARAFWIQGPGNAFYQKQGESRYQRTLELPATRGKILDRNGLVLATSLPVRAIWAIPESVPDDLGADKLTQLGQLLDMSSTELRRKLSEDKSFVYVKRQVPIEVADKVAALDIPGIYARNEYKRFYPEGEITAHLIGFTNVEDEGQEGVELADQKMLAGIPGSRHVIKDRVGHIVEDVDEQMPPHNGTDVDLSIDSKIQYITYANLKAAVDKFHAKAGAAVVVDVRTGEVLSLVNYPTYNPNDRSHLTGEQLRNRVLTDVFEPGSIMKPFTVSLALDLHRVSPTTLVDTGNGHFVLDGAPISDDAGFGVLTVGGVIQKSSNIGATKIAMTMRPEEMWNMYTSIGLGQAPKVGFPGAAAGRLRPWKSWRRIEQATMSYGYGLSVSLFQLAHAYTAIAHDGELMPLSIFKASETQPPQGPQVFSPTTAREVREMLESVVTKNGTSPDAAVPGYRVGGKSGTAYKQVGRGYDHKKYRASFVGMAPMPNPRIVVAVSVDEPTAGSHFGGQVSGPVFSAIVGDTLRALNVPPNMPVKQLVVSDDTAPAPGAPKSAGAQKLAALPASHLSVSSSAHNRPGVVR